MASTYAPSTALLYAKSFVKKMPVDTDPNINVQMLDYVHAAMWMAAPFRWTVGLVGNTTLVNSTTDYTVADPSDFLYIEGAYVAKGNSNEYLTPVSFLTNENITPGSPALISHPALNTYRVSPAPTQNYNSPLYIYYKKQRPMITTGNYTSGGVQVFDDEWFWVYQTGVLWQAYQYADDARAGGATVDQDGKTQYTGQLGIFRASLAEMRRSESLLMQWPGSVRQNG